jgi:hypothetical protein
MMVNFECRMNIVSTDVSGTVTIDLNEQFLLPKPNLASLSILVKSFQLCDKTDGL